ncbi:ISL3-like element IS469 family transposase [Glycomyces albus]
MDIVAATRTTTAVCPGCGTASDHKHSRYRRTLTDLGPSRSGMRIRLTVKRFRCRNASCERATFAEQVEGLTGRYRRTTDPAQQVLEHLGRALAGRAGARLAAVIGIRRSRHTLLRLLRALPDPGLPEAMPIIGIDDFAFRRGKTYGTVIVDQTGRGVLDVLSDRQTESVTAWLEGKRGIEVVCRDRANGYGSAISAAQPQAVQVADRWHLWKNLCDAVDLAVTANRRWVRSADDPTPWEPRPEDASPAGQQLGDGRRADNARRRWAEVHQFDGKGLTLKAIADRLGYDVQTVRRYQRADSPEELIAAGHRTPSLAPFDQYLRQRWTEGCRDGKILHAELTAMGWKGSDRTLRRYLEAWRGLNEPPPRASPSSARAVTHLLTCRPEFLDEDERLHRKQLLDGHEDLAELAAIVADFAQILTAREGHRLPEWIEWASRIGIRAIGRFAAGLQRDFAAVTAGLTLHHNSGRVEGHVNRIKMLKRQMYGRARFDLLRKRILLA